MLFYRYLLLFVIARLFVSLFVACWRFSVFQEQCHLYQLYSLVCVALVMKACALGAIKKGDSAGWAKLKQQKGMPALVSSVKNGMIQMPAGGLCDECSDDDYRQLIDYMSQ